MTENRERLHRLGNELASQGVEQENLIRRLRDEGASAADTLLVLKHVFGTSLSDGKDILDRSEAWADLREIHRRVHEEAYQIAEQMGFRSSVCDSGDVGANPCAAADGKGDGTP